MAGLKDAKDAVEKEAWFDYMVYIYVDNVLGKKPKKWVLKSIRNGGW